MTTWGRMPSAGFAHGQKWQLGPHVPHPVSGMASNGEQRHAHWRKRRCCPNSMDRAVGGQEQHGSTQRQPRRDKRAARQISHSCTQHHGHAPRPDTLWHHNAHGRPKGQWPSVLCTLAYPLGLGGTMGEAWLWTWPKNGSLGNMALSWFRAWSTNGVRRQAHWRKRRYCPNSMDRAAGGKE